MGQTVGNIPSASRSSAEIARTIADTAARRRAVVIAGHSGDADIALAGLQDDAAEVRASSLLALQRLERLTRSMIEAATIDDDPKVRQTAALVAAVWSGRRGPERPVDLLGLLRDPVPEVVEAAAWACGEDASDDETDEHEIPADEAILDELIGLATTHDDALVREAAVAALGALGDDRGLAAILQATTDKATVRRRAVIALAPFDGDDVDAALQHALTDRDWQVRQAAEDLLD